MMKHAAIHGLRRRDAGVTLVELIAFIVIAAIVAVAMIQAFSGTMRGSHFGKEMTQATQLAQQRMEVIMGQRVRLGYSGFTGTTYDSCPSVGTWSTVAPSPCATTTYAAGSFTVNTAYAAAVDCGTDCKEVTVTVTDPYGSQMAQLKTWFWNY